MSKKVQLIRPPLDSWYATGQIEEFVSVPIGLCIISKRLRDAGIEVSILDGIELTLEETIERIDGNVVGVSDMYSSHCNSLSILNEAKKSGATTVIGGPNVNYLAENIISNNDFVDFAVIGDGEETLPMLLTGSHTSSIQNLVYRMNDRAIRNCIRDSPLDTIFDLDDISNKPADFGSIVAPLSSIRGCIKAEKSGRCSFCSIYHKLKLMDPDLVWKQIGLLKEKYGITSFLETGDTFMVGTYPNKILERRPNDLDEISLGRIYASPDQIDEHSAETLRQLNVRYVYLGIESVNDNVLCEAGRSYRRSDIEPAIDLLERKDMLFHVPFMYGLSGDTLDSMEETFRFAKKMVSKHPSIKVLSSLAIPLPGSKLFEGIKNHEIARNEYNGNLYRDDTFDYQSLARLQLKYFTETRYDDAVGMVMKTRDLVSNKANVTSFDINK